MSLSSGPEYTELKPRQKDFTTSTHQILLWRTRVLLYVVCLIHSTAIPSTWTGTWRPGGRRSPQSQQKWCVQTAWILGVIPQRQKKRKVSDNWIDANMKWLKDTFGSENLVSCVLHMDEKTPHLHPTIVPIVTTERLRKKREEVWDEIRSTLIGRWCYAAS